jgi:hypothetical protein
MGQRGCTRLARDTPSWLEPEMPGKRTPRSFKRGGLHKLACFCGNYTYGTVAALERYGLPTCGCGERLEPERLELALLLDLDLPVVREYRRRAHRKTMAQSAHARRPCADSSGFASMEMRALAEISAEQRAQARARRLNALLPAAEPLPF